MKTIIRSLAFIAAAAFLCPWVWAQVHAPTLRERVERGERVDDPLIVDFQGPDYTFDDLVRRAASIVLAKAADSAGRLSAN